MLNFENLSSDYRWRIQRVARDLMNRQIQDHLLKGGEFDAQKITKMFGTACRTAQLIVDLEIGTGLDPFVEEKEYDEDNQETQCSDDAAELGRFIRDDVGDFGESGTERPAGSDGTPEWMVDPKRTSNPVDYHGAAGGGEVDPPEQQPVPPVTRPRTGRGHGSGPSSPPVQSPAGDESDGPGPSVPHVRGSAHRP